MGLPPSGGFLAKWLLLQPLFEQPQHWPWALGVLFGNSVTGQDGGFTLEGFRALLADSQYVEAFGNTLILGLAVTTCTVLVGVPFAYMVARYDFPLKNLVAILPVLTIVIPEIIVGQSWLLILGNNGLLTNLLGDAGISLPSFYGWTGMLFSMTLVYYTYIYLGVLAALRGFDGQLEEAGLSLGTPPLLTKLRVLVPVLLPLAYKALTSFQQGQVNNRAAGLGLTSQDLARHSGRGAELKARIDAVRQNVDQSDNLGEGFKGDARVRLDELEQAVRNAEHANPEQRRLAHNSVNDDLNQLSAEVHERLAK